MKTLNDNVNCNCQCDCPTIPMTPATEKGIYVGQGVYKYTGNSDGYLTNGDIVVLANDDGSRCPLFQRIDQYMKYPAHDGYVSQSTHATFAYVWEVEELAPASEIPEQVCTCECTCSPAKLAGMTVGKTVVKVLTRGMREYIAQDQFAVLVRDDNSECPMFQRLDRFLNGDDATCGVNNNVCFLSLQHVEVVNEFTS